MAARQSTDMAATTKFEPLIEKDNQRRKFVAKEDKKKASLPSTIVPIIPEIDAVDVDISIGKTERTNQRASLSHPFSPIDHA